MTTQKRVDTPVHKGMIDEKIIIAGSGGQGIIFLGKTLARAATREHKHTTWIPSYGAEMRGGTAHCFVRISSQEIASPMFEHPSMAVIFNQPSCDKFAPKLKKSGLLIVNSSLITTVKKCSAVIKEVPLNLWALKIGALQVANSIALGVLVRYKNLLNQDTLEKVLTESFAHKKEIGELNVRAFQWGVNHG
jgi:2-oxoglutarate ferredoxin oxidoreductase subunit gamma